MQREQSRKNGGPYAAERSRGGRPSAERAGDVDRRILDAGAALLLEQGFEATTCEQVAARAGAGKASIYSRYANKEELFEAVIRDYVRRSMENDGRPYVMPTVQERLRVAGEDLLTHSLQPDVIGMMRAVVTTVYRMPDLARLANQIGRDHCVRQMARAVAGDQTETMEVVARASNLASKFIELAVVPHQMRALMGEDPASLLDAALNGVDESIALLSKGGWLDGWK